MYICKYHTYIICTNIAICVALQGPHTVARPSRGLVCHVAFRMPGVAPVQNPKKKTLQVIIFRSVQSREHESHNFLGSQITCCQSYND